MFEIPALIVVILSIDVSRILRVYWRWEETCFIDSMALEGEVLLKSDFFYASQFLVKELFIPIF